MALRDFLQFDALPAIANATTLAASCLPFLRSDIGLAIPASGTISCSNSGGLLSATAGYGNSTTAQTGITLPYANVSNFACPQSYFGFRLAATLAGTGSLTNLGLAWITNSSGVSQILVPIPVTTSFAQQYVEVMIDRANNQVVYWFDGVQQPAISFNFNAFAGSGAVTIGLGLQFTVAFINSSVTWSLRDIYFVDNTQDATLCTRLGSVQVLPAPLETATAPNYVSSDGAGAFADLSTPLGTTAATQTAPTLATPISMDTIDLTLNTSGLPVLNILGARLDMSALRNSGAALSFISEAQYNGESVSGKVALSSSLNTMKYNLNALLMEKAPDGSQLTPAVLSQMQFSLTPETIV